jgi:hypothetical protein
MQIALFCLVFVLGSCKNLDEPIEVSRESTYEVNKKIEPIELDQYDHQVTGTDENGNKVEGKINIDGKIGLGTLINHDAKEIEIVVEWINERKLVATDPDGYEYKLTIK